MVLFRVRSAFRVSCKLAPFVRSVSTQHRKTQHVKKYLVPLTVGCGTAFMSYRYVFIERRIEDRADSGSLITDLQVDCYRLLPLNVISRSWGEINSIELPLWLRSPILRLYAWLFSCNLDEAANPNLKDYRNLGQFFRRDLKPGCRPIDTTCPVVCPSDGVVLSCGTVTKDQVKEVKGVVYTLSNFLGPETFLTRITSPAEKESTALTRDSIDTVYEDRLKRSHKNNLYHCVIYLAPGDYHHFHSPTDWKVSYRRHFPGCLLSVNPRIVRRIPQLFNLNERVVYFGDWQGGFFAMALVGATNVGSIHVYNDRELLTNCSRIHAQCIDHDFQRDAEVMTFCKGAPFGEFNLGSTVVLVFEASENFKFTVQSGQKVKYGQPLGV